MGSIPRLLFVITEDWYFWSHRLDLARAARDAGYLVTIATRVTNHGECIRQEGFQLEPLDMVRRSRNPLQELAAIVELVRLYRRVKPDVVHHVAMKPILYGSMAAWFSPVPVVINAFAGLGYVFTSPDRRWRGMRWAILVALRLVIRASRSTVLFQNEMDRDELIEMGIVQPSRTHVIAGSGVDIEAFSVRPSPQGTPVVVLPSRMLWDKGVGEFVAAARDLKKRGVAARFVLVGRSDEDNPAAICCEQLAQWVDEGSIEWWGHRDDMSEVYASASIVVLPSYREGLPKVLLEAAACGKAIVTTDVPGCREVVSGGVNGILVPPRNSSALATAIAGLLSDQRTCDTMGARGREMVEAKWAGPRIIQQVLGLYQERLRASSALNRSHGYA